jgi:hypothetical protein
VIYESAMSPISEPRGGVHPRTDAIIHTDRRSGETYEIIPPLDLRSTINECIVPPPVGTIRTFDTGATRDTDAGKLDYEGFLSPLALERFAEYMNKNRVQSDGSIRDSDNWQKGIPLTAYMKSMWRHFFKVWRGHRDGHDVTEELCALFFNVQGYLHESLKARESGDA